MKKLALLILSVGVLLTGCGDGEGGGYSVEMKEQLMAVMQ